MTNNKVHTGYLLQLIGGWVATYAFFCLPYLVVRPTNLFTADLFATAAQLGTGNPAYPRDRSGFPSNPLAGSSLYWFLLALAITITIATSIQTYRSRINAENSTETTAYLLCIPTGITLFILLWNISSASIQGNAIAVDYASGFWVYVASLLLVLIGGIVVKQPKITSTLN